MRAAAYDAGCTTESRQDDSDFRTRTQRSSSDYAAIEGRHNPLVKELRQAFAHAERTEDG